MKASLSEGLTPEGVQLAGAFWLVSAEV
jgi:hypothetical protein